MNESVESGSTPLLRVDDLHTRFATEQGPLRAVAGVSFEAIADGAEQEMSTEEAGEVAGEIDGAEEK